VKLLYLIAAVFLLFWVVGFLFKFVISPLIHLALIAGVALLVWNAIQGNRPGRTI
jgi:hypothetical protein